MRFNSAFVTVVGVLVEITSSAVGLKICVLTVGIKKYKSIIKKKKKKYYKIVFSAKVKLNKIEVLTSKPFNDSNISNHEFITMNNVL